MARPCGSTAEGERARCRASLKARRRTASPALIRSPPPPPPSVVVPYYLPCQLHDGELLLCSSIHLEHLNESLSLEALARHVGMSPRTLTRWCRRELGESPAALVRRVRIEEAQRLLEQTSLPLKDIAARAHLGDPSTLWRIFTRYVGATPADYRARYAARAIVSRRKRGGRST